MSRRRAHNRTNRFGTTFSVREHNFDRGVNGRRTTHQDFWSATGEYQHSVVESEVKPLDCWFCGDRIFYYSNEFGSKVFFNSLGKPWPKHACPNWDKRVENGDTKFRRWVTRNGGNSLEEILPIDRKQVLATLRDQSGVDLSQLVGSNKIGSARKTKKPASAKKKVRKPVRQEPKDPNKEWKQRTAKNREAWEAAGKPISGRYKTAEVEVRKSKPIKTRKAEK